MAIRKIYVSDGLELEIRWDTDGIYLHIQEPDVERSICFRIETSDIQDVIDDMECFSNAIYEEKYTK
jgi:hypothetical protein